MFILKIIFIMVIIFLQIFTALHALLYKRDPKSAWGWIVVSLFFPPFGSIFYLLFGINRVRTKAKKLKWRWVPFLYPELNFDEDITFYFTSKDLSYRNYIITSKFSPMARISDAITKRPLLKSNRVIPLLNGDAAYPKMLKAIESAEYYVFLTTFIFDTGPIGMKFIHLLSHAVKRGVDVRIIVDGIGEFYSYPRVGPLLKKNRIPFARFLPPRIYPLSPFLNLRNHRKILIVDGAIGFTGGMNIREKHIVGDLSDPSKVQDIHFQLEGPIVSQMEEIFLEDWGFCTGKYDSPRKRKDILPKGEAICRSITIGPNHDLNRLNIILTGAVSLAHEAIYIITPYFLPSRELIGALQAAALRGVDVNIVLPEKNNLPYVHWATQNMLWELLTYGVKVFYQPPPFAHTKIFLVDNFYLLIGSANIDPRSLRLNFEVVVEVFDNELGRCMSSYINKLVGKSRQIYLHEVDSRPFWIRVRDSICWLFTPFL